jgi:hypothetical protein
LLKYICCSFRLNVQRCNSLPPSVPAATCQHQIFAIAMTANLVLLCQIYRMNSSPTSLETSPWFCEAAVAKGPAADATCVQRLRQLQYCALLGMLSRLRPHLSASCLRVHASARKSPPPHQVWPPSSVPPVPCHPLPSQAHPRPPGNGARTADQGRARTCGCAS